jgi:hypothetical protein
VKIYCTTRRYIPQDGAHFTGWYRGLTRGRCTKWTQSHPTPLCSGSQFQLVTSLTCYRGLYLQLQVLSDVQCLLSRDVCRDCTPPSATAELRSTSLEEQDASDQPWLDVTHEMPSSPGQAASCGHGIPGAFMFITTMI